MKAAEALRALQERSAVQIASREAEGARTLRNAGAAARHYQSLLDRESEEMGLSDTTEVSAGSGKHRTKRVNALERERSRSDSGASGPPEEDGWGPAPAATRSYAQAAVSSPADGTRSKKKAAAQQSEQEHRAVQDQQAVLGLATASSLVRPSAPWPSRHTWRSIETTSFQFATQRAP